MHVFTPSILLAFPEGRKITDDEIRLVVGNDATEGPYRALPDSVVGVHEPDVLAAGHIKQEIARSIRSGVG
ncbi:hypothetical protein COL154_014281 [Colletotrichum chrysophilum]|nr:hypothetical protein COL154_014281 [Colletotrichum chrysophilum]